MTGSGCIIAVMVEAISWATITCSAETSGIDDHAVGVNTDHIIIINVGFRDDIAVIVDADFSFDGTS